MSKIDRLVTMAKLSQWTYKSKKEALPQFKKLGYKTATFYDIDGAQAYVISNDEEVVIAFRGTQTREKSDIYADLQFFKTDSLKEGKVHRGFQGEVDKLWAKITKKIKDKEVYLTGHSLGAAMATIAAVRLGNQAKGLYTYGSPRVGNKRFIKNITCSHNRVVNNNDVVAKIPFWILGFRHHGQLLYLNYYGNIRNATWWQRFKDGFRGRWRALKKKQAFDGIYDHAVGMYTRELEKNANTILGS